MPENPDISSLVKNLISLAYPELIASEVSISWRRTSSFAQIHWSESKEEISIRINNNVKIWHEAGIIGLLSHELSHPAQEGSGFSELKTDEDAISRGLGPYLAVERVFAGKYEDHAIKRGKDRYLGYRSIREQLTYIESNQLDLLLANIRLIPSKRTSRATLNHDIAIYDKERITTLAIDGHQFQLPQSVLNPEIKIVERNCVTLVYVDEVLVGQFSKEKNQIS